MLRGKVPELKCLKTTGIDLPRPEHASDPACSLKHSLSIGQLDGVKDKQNSAIRMPTRMLNLVACQEDRVASCGGPLHLNG